MADEAKPTDGTVADLKNHLATVDDHGSLDQLRKDEEAGKNRAGALDAIDARKAEITDAGDADNGNTTKAGGDTSVDATHDEGGAPSTVLAEVDDPASLTKGDIDDITAGGTDAETGPRADAAENLEQTLDAAKKGEDQAEASYLHGYGPGADI